MLRRFPFPAPFLGKTCYVPPCGRTTYVIYARALWLANFKRNGGAGNKHLECEPAGRTHWPAHCSRFVSPRAMSDHPPHPLGWISRGGLQEISGASHGHSLCEHSGRPRRARSTSIPTPWSPHTLPQSFSHGRARRSCRTSACQHQLLHPDARGQLHAASRPGQHVGVRDAANEGRRYGAVHILRKRFA